MECLSCSRPTPGRTSPETRGSLAKIGVNVPGGSPDELAAYIKREDAKWMKAIRDSDTKID